MDRLIRAGKEMGLEGKALQDFMREQQAIERERGASEGAGNKAPVRSRREGGSAPSSRGREGSPEKV